MTKGLTTRDLRGLKYKLRTENKKSEPFKIVTTRDREVARILRDKKEGVASDSFFRSRWLGGAKGIKTDASKLLEIDQWKNRACFIIAGGPSVEKMGFDKLNKAMENDIVIGVNRAYEDFDLDVLFAMDMRYYEGIKRKAYDGIRKDEKKPSEIFANFDGLKLWVDLRNYGDFDPKDNIFYLRSKARTGYKNGTTIDGIYHGNNSGFGALSFAVAMGCNPIHLIGFDMGFSGAKSHYHEGHPTRLKEDMMKSFRHAFEYLSRVKPSELKIYNYSKSSKLTCFPKKKELPKTEARTPRFVTFHTDDKFYNSAALKLKKSFWKWALKFDVEKIKPFGTWAQHTQYKPEFILKMLNKYPGQPIIWVDADAEIKQFPELFYGAWFSDIMIGKRHRKGFEKDGELLSGTMYFANNKEVKDFLKKWVAECKKMDNKGWDQWPLKKLLSQNKLNYKELPFSYVSIFDAKEKTEPAVIEHGQISRETRRIYK